MRGWQVVWLALTILSVGAVAQEQAPAATSASPPYEFLHNYITIDVNADGTFTNTRDQLLLVHTQEGVRHLTYAPISYSESMQEGDLVEVYTIKPDGTRIDAPVDSAFVQSMPLAVNAPTFADLKMKSIPFAKLEVGDKVGMVTRVRQKVPLINGHFSHVQTFSRGYVARDQRLVVTAPKDGFSLKVEARGLENKPASVVNGRRQWSWTSTNLQPEAAEPGDVGEFDTAPRVVISSLPDYAALAKAYETGAREKTAVTPEIQRQADKLTTGIDNRREQARVIYEWVAKNVRYVQVPLGMNAIVPHSAAEVLSNLYGDCKDHVTILQALLKAKNIESTTALINLGDNFQIAQVATLQQFNHAITYIPEMKLYVDSTERFVPFGIVHLLIADKPTLLTASGKLDHTPWGGPENRYHTVTTIKVQGDGSADVETRITVSGAHAVATRGAIAAIPPGQEQARLLPGNISDVRLDRGKPGSLTDPYEISMRYRVSNYLQIPGPGAISFAIGPNLGGRVANRVVGRTTPYKRDFMCSAGRYLEDVTVELPASLKVTNLPKSQETTIENLKFHLTYTRENDHTIKAAYLFEADEPHRYCSAEQVARIRPDIVKMHGRLGAQALYE